MSDKDKESAGSWRRLIDLARSYWKSETPCIDQVFLTKSDGSWVLQEGKLVPGRFDQNIRIDAANYGAGMKHAHVLGVRGTKLGLSMWMVPAVTEQYLNCIKLMLMHCVLKVSKFEMTGSSNGFRSI